MCTFWAKDSLKNVVLSAKNSNQILVVLVEGVDELSRKVSSALSAPGFQTSMTNGFIGYRIINGSEDFNHFSRIYSISDVLKKGNNLKSLKIPCVLFIGALGLPLAVIQVEDVIDFETFNDEINNLFIKFCGVSAIDAAKMVYKHENNNSGVCYPILEAYKMASEVMSDVGKKSQLINDEVALKENTKKINTSSCDLPQNIGIRSSRSLGKVAETKPVVSVETKPEVSVETRPVVSVETRPVISTETKPVVSVTTSSNINENNEISNGNVVQRHGHDQKAKILFRLPNGKTVSQTFPFSTPLSEVRKYVREQIGVRSFDLSFLARIKKEEELLTLEQLNMIPSAVLLVLPVASVGSSVLTKGYSRLVSLFWYLAMPVITYLQYINSFLFGGDGRFQGRRVGGSSSSSNPPPPPPSGGGSGPQRQHPTQNRSNKYTRSNIHTLRSVSDDNNSQNTYNGNSTQQMP